MTSKRFLLYVRMALRLSDFTRNKKKKIIVDILKHPNAEWLNLTGTFSGWTEMTARPQFEATAERASDNIFILILQIKRKTEGVVVVFMKSAASQGNKLKFQSTLSM